MISWVKMLIAGIFVSCYFFPFEFTFLPGVNTKMAMAGVGLVSFAIALVAGGIKHISRDGFTIAVIATLVSICGLLSVVVNNTNDYTYATYIVSMLVWLGGAYTAVGVVRKIHGYASVELMCNYVIAVCVGQCVVALLIDSVPVLKSVVDRFVVGFDFVDVEMLDRNGRLYGIGAALDVAGTRFATVLVMISVLLQRLSASRYKRYMWLYLGAFVVISIVGNMMARTTTVGILIAIVYLVMTSGVLWMYIRKNSVRIWASLIILMSLLLPIIIHLYFANEQFHDNIRFAFEGFFSLAEKGQWETNSNNILKEMIVFPDNYKTWLIGDGYFDNPYWSDPYYSGPNFKGYYMQTDIGYLRFIFYFGLIGLISFIIYFCKVATTCVQRFPSFSKMFWLMLLVNMIVWLKVSTDIFLVFAIFLCISKEENDAYEKEYEDSIPNSLDV